ncbi:MAG: 16S rRNA (guanine(527)-N(7))-methyltransferase RsmG [Acidobacteriia bacterium]|nr:16S rRNA (guanine(527)-N(7))-methyltransferase RsmG [Terriglobia bacterium]
MFRELLVEKTAAICALKPAQAMALECHYNQLVKWNRTLNLTSINSVEEAVERHYCEGLFLAAHLPAQDLRIADIGSGAGFPGFPVAVLREDCIVTLIESHRRKAVFLQEVSRYLPNIRVLASRAGQVSEHFDRAISRAVAYKDLIPVLKNMANAADLLTGGEAPPAEIGFIFSTPIRLPWGRNRYLRQSICST